ncbi:uncharacterized protein K452DRAFT_3075 [Aplosporella prunicola CBS 121167]|uniref:Uncharacterized protein n=1 Tax=Aplosporella prunicola CBS 121167 TaxID=1176127 RepID=A0A6A6BT66_9PEZI|nr:uncharacterized protein K452DRAFT_3075 [Aplosporella prunicola CBS 121167]KAF2147190.1 hypothetical protein K452DRAFT_3075 [Aplosporella prunicola CBS 121167]
MCWLTVRSSFAVLVIDRQSLTTTHHRPHVFPNALLWLRPAKPPPCASCLAPPARGSARLLTRAVCSRQPCKHHHSANGLSDKVTACVILSIASMHLFLLFVVHWSHEPRRHSSRRLFS